MGIRKAVVVAAGLTILFASIAWGDGAALSPGKRTPGSGPVLTCRTVYAGEKPILESLEDGLAYLLDIPLAMLSPITCPVVAPLLEWIDAGPNRTYKRSGRP